MNKVDLLDNNGTAEYRKLALELKNQGVTEDEFIAILDKRLVGWREDNDMSKRIKTLLDILFHTFF